MLGQTLGNFQITEKMSEGGMGKVYLARHVSLDRRAVVKVLRSHLVEDEDMVRRFLNEANAAAMIGHPGIVYVMDVGRLESGSPYILMEYLEGESLAQRLERIPMLDIPSAVSIVRQVADALAAAHDKAIVHRDLKPGNIYLIPDSAVEGSERVKILDFGIAKLLSSNKPGVVTHSDMIMGTPMYMSPEQCDGARSVDHRADLYALGCILFELVCGRPPFAQAGSGAVIAAHLMKPPPSPRELQPGVSLELEAVILRLLAKSPDARFPDARALIAALDALGQDGNLGRRSSARMAAVAPVTGQHTPLPWKSPSTPAPGRETPTTMPARPGADGHKNVTTILSSGESIVASGLGRERRRTWPVLVGCAMALAGAVVALPLLSGDREPRASSPKSAIQVSTPATTSARAAAQPEATTQPEARPEAADVPAAPAAGNAAPADVAIEIASEPSAASVLHNGKLVGQTPYRGTYPSSDQELTFVISKPGYENQEIRVSAARGHQQRVTLARSQAAAGKRIRREPPRTERPPESRSKLRPEEGGPIDPFE